MAWWRINRRIERQTSRPGELFIHQSPRGCSEAVRGRNLTANILACWKSGSSSMSDVGQWLPGGLGREIRRISDQSHHQRQPGGHEDTEWGWWPGQGAPVTWQRGVGLLHTPERGWQMVVCSIEAGLCRAVRTVRTRQPADQHGQRQLTWTDTPAPSPPGPRQGNLTSSHCDVMCHDVWRDDWPLYSNEMSYSCRSRGGAGGRCHVSFLSPVQSYDVTPRSPPYLTEVKL